jgi:hypothetical protein
MRRDERTGGMSEYFARRICAVIFVCGGILFACVHGFAAAPAAIPPSSEIVPEMIGEGVISTIDDEFGGTPSSDGQTLYFDKTVPPHYLYVICQAHMVSGKWGNPEVMPFSGLYRDSDPVLSPDGNTMYFASDRAVDGVEQKRFLIWETNKRGEGWSEPTLVGGAINSDGSQVFASTTKDGTMYFTSSRKNGQYDIYRAILASGKYQVAEDLGPVVNQPGVWSLEAWVAPDETYLLIGSFGREGYGNSDLYVSFREHGTWGKPIDLPAPINTAAREYSARVSADGKWLYYSSEWGMPYEKRTQPLTYQQFVEGMKSVKNGLGNLYRVPLEPVLAAAKAKAGSAPK